MLEQFTSGDVVVITGGAQGIGRAIAQRLARMGGRIAIWDLNQCGGDETAAICRQAGVEAHFDRVDLAEPTDIERACTQLRANFGIPYALVNNASIYPRSHVMALELCEWESVVRVNLTAPFLCSRMLGSVMIEAGRGTIINISSTVALRGDPYGAHYSASKAGLISFTKSLALALAPKVRANCILPGIADTAQPLGAMTRNELLGRGKGIPMGRVGQPDDVAGVVAFLLGADALYLTGQSIVVNGGALMVP